MVAHNGYVCMNEKYHRPPRKKFSKKSYTSKIKPGSDAKLKKVFERIGVPKQKPFKPDAFQLESLEAVETADCLVTVPTGAGKTWIAEQAIARKHEDGGKSWYASPLKALSNSIYARFKELFGENQVGILTGDRKENPDAPIIVGTTEILRNQLYDAMYKGVDLATDFVVLDEAHYLGDTERGVVWEEVMIYLPTRIPLLMLSATVGNAAHIAGWLESIRSSKCIVVQHDQRPVPLYPLFFHPSGTLFPLLAKPDPKRKRILYKKVVNYLNSRHPPQLAPPSRLAPMGQIMKVLKKYNLLPAIFFLKSRADCDGAIKLCSGKLLHQDPERKLKLSRRIDELIAEHPYLASYEQLWHLRNLGVGSHHSGQLPIWKEFVETLMSEGLLDAVFATSTVAAGVNFPARTVVLFNSDRYNGSEFISLNATQFHQMTGRAGRRGKDKIGFAVSIPGKFMNLRLIAKLIDAPPVDVHSQIRINFSMVLNLLLSHTPEKIHELLNKSFASYLMKERKKNKKPQGKPQGAQFDFLWRDFGRHLDFLKAEGFVAADDTLTDDGIWASQLRIDEPLMVAEGFRQGVFPESDPALLAAIIATFVNERESDDNDVDRTFSSKQLTKIFYRTQKKLKPFAERMLKSGFETHPLYLQPAVTVYAWAYGIPWEKVLTTTDLAEGDLARLIFRTADNLRHIGNLHDTFPKAATAAREAIDLIMKEPVVT